MLRILRILVADKMHHADHLEFFISWPEKPAQTRLDNFFGRTVFRWKAITVHLADSEWSETVDRPHLRVLFLEPFYRTPVTPGQSPWPTADLIARKSEQAVKNSALLIKQVISVRGKLMLMWSWKRNNETHYLVFQFQNLLLTWVPDDLNGWMFFNNNSYCSVKIFLPIPSLDKNVWLSIASIFCVSYRSFFKFLYDSVCWRFLLSVILCDVFTAFVNQINKILTWIKSERKSFQIVSTPCGSNHNTKPALDITMWCDKKCETRNNCEHLKLGWISRN